MYGACNSAAVYPPVTVPTGTGSKYAVRHLSPVAGLCLLRVGREHCAPLLQALPAVGSLCHESVDMRLLKVSGSSRVALRVTAAEHEKRSSDMADGLPRKVRKPQTPVHQVPCDVHGRAGL